MALVEVEYTRTGQLSGEVLRRQLLQVPGGWALSPAVPEGTGPESLRYHRGGTNRWDHVFEDRSKAEKFLADGHWIRKAGAHAIESEPKKQAK